MEHNPSNSSLWMDTSEGAATPIGAKTDVQADLVTLAINQEIAKLRNSLCMWPPASNKTNAGERLVMLMRMRAQLSTLPSFQSGLTADSEARHAVSMSPASSSEFSFDSKAADNADDLVKIAQYKANAKVLKALQHLKRRGDKSAPLSERISELMKEQRELLNRLSPMVARLQAKRLARL